MKLNCVPWIKVITLVVLGSCLGACARHSRPVLEAEYPVKIVGSWQGTVGDLKERIAINGDGTFVCQLRPAGFIANTLSQGVTGTVQGTWTIAGAMITLSVTRTENETLKNTIAVSTIEAFREDELVLKSDRGGTSLFRRVIML